MACICHTDSPSCDCGGLRFLLGPLFELYFLQRSWSLFGKYELYCVGVVKVEVARNLTVVRRSTSQAERSRPVRSCRAGTLSVWRSIYIVALAITVRGLVAGNCGITASAISYRRTVRRETPGPRSEVSCEKLSGAMVGVTPTEHRDVCGSSGVEAGVRTFRQGLCRVSGRSGGSCCVGRSRDLGLNGSGSV